MLLSEKKKLSRLVTSGDRKLQFRYDVATGVAHTSEPSDLENLRNSIFGEFFRDGMCFAPLSLVWLLLFWPVQGSV